MKRLIFVIGGLLALPAFAEVSPYYFDEMYEFIDPEMVDEENGVLEAGVVIEQDTTKTTKPAIAIRPTARANTSPRVSSRANSDNRATVSRGVTSRGASVSRDTQSATTSRGVASRASVSRAANNNSGVVSRRGTSVNSANVARAATSTTTKGTVMLKDSTGSLYLPNRNIATRSSSSRVPSVSVSNVTTATTTATSVQDAVENMDSLAELTDYCKAQYTACMDNFCNVLDDNQGRCTCSKNVKNYEKIEEALASATEALQDVAQKIQYIGLSADEITTLFTQTEAELAMNNATDSTALKNDLDRIKKMIVDVKTGASSAVSETVMGSLDFTNLFSLYFDSYGISLSTVFGSTSSATTQSIGNQRGEALYKSAASRCKTAVLNNCTAQGVEASVIVNAYDMEIDKQCIVYERALTDSNRQMTATVRNAKTVLQKARLMVAQQKNQYDLRGCINALDTCMMDDYVCGNDYTDCLDPTGKYIVDGTVVSGSMPGQPGGDWTKVNGDTITHDNTRAASGLYTVWNKGGTGEQNIWSPSASNTYTMATYIGDTLNMASAQSRAPKDISEYLQTKIGYHDNNTGRNHGMCMSVLNKCQLYTYDDKGQYLANNQVIAEYMQRAFRQIKSAQDTVLANYASSCLSDVTACLSQNNYSFSTSASNNPSNIAIRACLPVINTCRSVTLGLSEAEVNINDLSPVYAWLDAGIATTYKTTCETSGGEWNATTGVCDCSSLTNSTQDSAKRSCVCNTGYNLSSTGTSYECSATSTDS